MMNVTHLSRCYVKKLTFQDIKWGTLLSLELLKSLQKNEVPPSIMAEIFAKKNEERSTLPNDWNIFKENEVHSSLQNGWNLYTKRNDERFSLQNGWNLCKEKRGTFLSAEWLKSLHRKKDVLLFKMAENFVKKSAECYSCKYSYPDAFVF